MSILDDTHNLYTTGHVFDPFLVYFVFGNPLLALAVAGIWEIMEYVVFTTFGHYSVFFLNDVDMEPMWDVLVLDIGGTLVGTLIAANLTFYLEGQFVPFESLWDGKNKLYVVLLFVARAVVTMPLSALGWECNTVIDLCTDNGYHLFPWGVLGLLLVNGAYIWYNFKDKTPRQYDQNKKATWMLVCLFVINAPTFQRAVPASYIQVIVLGGLSVLELLVWLYLYCQPGYKLRKRRRRVDYGPVRT